MANTFTLNYSYTKPEIGADSNLWGTHWNENLDRMDSQLFKSLDKSLTTSQNLSGAITLPVNGLNVGSGQLNVSGGNVSATGSITSSTSLISTGTLAITGAATFASTLGVTGVTTLSGALNVSGATALASNGLNVGSGQLAVSSGNVSTSGNLSVSGTFNSSGAATMSSTLNVLGVATLASNGLNVGSGQLQVTGGNVGVSGNFSSSGNGSFGGTLGVTGSATFSSTMAVTGAATFSGSVTVPTPSSGGHATTKTYVDNADALKLSLTGGTMSGGLTIQNTAPTITMADTDNGTFSIHCNSALIGFLGTAGGWISRTDNSGNFTATGNVTAYSDERIKDDIHTIEYAVARLKALRGVYYKRKDTGAPGVGVIAQEVQQIFPEVVHENEDGMLSVAYGNLVGVLIEAVKELADRVEELEYRA